MRLKRNPWLLLLGIGTLLALIYFGWQFTTQNEVCLFALDAETGRVKWSTSVDTKWAFTPGAGNGRVFAYALVPIPKKNGDHSEKNTVKLCAFDATTGRQTWEYLVDPKQFDFWRTPIA
jgi:outer membrane protein assembly factor BamB